MLGMMKCESRLKQTFLYTRSNHGGKENRLECTHLPITVVITVIVTIISSAAAIAVPVLCIGYKIA
jgi:hypothetical protein